MYELGYPVTFHDPAPQPPVEQLIADVLMSSLHRGGHHERLQIFAAAQAAGYDDTYVVCDRHNTGAITFVQFIRVHWPVTEHRWAALHRAELGPNSADHHLGSVRPAYYAEATLARIDANARRHHRPVTA